MNQQVTERAFPGLYPQYRELELRYKTEVARYEEFLSTIGRDLPRYNGRIQSDIRMGSHFYRDLRSGLAAASVGKPISEDKINAYMDLLMDCVEVLSHENDILEAVRGWGIVSAIQHFPVLPYIESAARVSRAITRLETELIEARQRTTEAAKQLAINATLTYLTGAMKSIGLAGTALKGAAAYTQYYVDENLGGSKSTQTMDELDNYLDKVAAPTLVAIDGVEQKMKTTFPLVAKVGKLSDALSVLCDVDELATAAGLLLEQKQRLRAAKDELVNALRALERINDESRPMRLRVYHSIEHSRKMMAEEREAAKFHRDIIYQRLEEEGIRPAIPAVWN